MLGYSKSRTALNERLRLERHWFNFSKEEEVACDANQEIGCCYAECPGEGVACGNEVTSEDGRGDSGELIGEVDDAAHRPDTAARSDERGYGPADGSRT